MESMSLVGGAPAPSPEVLHLPHRQPSLVVFSGGTAFNGIAGLLLRYTTKVAHVLPVSDDGGSTAEIVRVIGGPAVGDIRSRCLRLADDSDIESKAVKKLLGHRLSAHNSQAAKLEWYSIVEGEHELWADVSEPYKHTIRAFLVHFHSNILRHSSERFSFVNGSVGNFFFAGARIFFRSLEAAIFLFSRVARIAEGCKVLPAISTDSRITLAAELGDGTMIRGQNAISHPNSVSTPGPQQVNKNAAVGPPLSSPISRVFYLSSDGDENEHEVSFAANPQVISHLGTADSIVFGMGSLWTSICPSLMLQGVGEAVAAQHVPKILLLNGSLDRETSCSQFRAGAMSAADVVQAVTDTLNRKDTRFSGSALCNSSSAYITHLFLPDGCEFDVDRDELRNMGVRRIEVVDSRLDKHGRCMYDSIALVDRLRHVLDEELDSRPSMSH